MQKCLLILTMLAFCSGIQAQTNPSKFKLGMGLMAQKSTLEVFLSDRIQPGMADLDKIELDEKIGASLQLDIHYLLGKKSSLRFSPGVFFQTNAIDFVFTDKNDVSVKILPVGLALPFFFQYAPQGISKGPRFFTGIELQQLLGSSDNPYISLYDYNIQGKIGVAVPFNSRWIKWIPSLTYGMGLENLKKFETGGGEFNTYVDAIQLNTLQLGVSIIFQKSPKENVD